VRPWPASASWLVAACSRCARDSQDSKFDFLVNLRAAQAIGLTIPDSVLTQATELIQ
jgi:hypothetical protein